MLPMTANLLLVVLAPAVVLAFVWTVTLLERRRAERRAPSESVRRGTATGPFMLAPEDCAHDDVAADWHPAVAAWRSGLFTPPASGVLNQGGTCRRCGSRVVRHGNPEHWSAWLADPTEEED